MAVRCPKCHAENADTARFCSNCATSLTFAEAGPPAAAKTIESPTPGVGRGAVFSGRYEILDGIGAGGMGEVYLALDKNLGRHVAIKILPAAFAEDKERMARFEREAKLLAVLNHPNIAAIHGLEESGGRRFLVLELAEGETLQARLNRGPLPIDEALETCRQIAEGLEAAHGKGIVHRDLKPGNLMLTPEGQVKILDFGLAKAPGGETTGTDVENSPTITAAMTEPGVILGTAAYMSPEQAKGRAVDKRADIWAFGCVLFECLAGKRAFQGDTVSETIAAILKGEPDWTLLPANTPPSVRAVLRRCLQKDPRERLHDIADARVEMLEEAPPSGEAVSAGRRFPLHRVFWISAAMLAIGILAGVMMKPMRPGASRTSQPVVRSVIGLEHGQWLDGLRLSPPFGFDRPTRTAIAISKDGSFMVYASVKENPGPQDDACLYLRRFNALEAKPLAGTEGGISPFLSPDDRWVGFWANGKLMKVSIEGGVPAALCDVSLPFGFSWGGDNQIVFAPARGSGLSRIAAEGGKLETLTVPDRSRGEFAHRLPFCLPQGKGVLFTIMRHAWDKQPRVAVLELGTRKWHDLLEDAADARYVSPGYLAFLRRGTLMVVRFDLDRLEVVGQPVPAVAGIEQALSTTNSTRDTAAGQFCISTSGTLVYARGGIYPDQENTLILLDRTGKPEPVASFKAPFFAPRFSPDGRRVAYSSLGMEGHIWILDLDRGTSSQLTSEGLSEYTAWTPDGRRVTFDLVNAGVPNIYWQPVDRSSPMERLTQGEYFQWPCSWSPDGETLAFVEDHADMEAGSDIQLLHIRDRTVTPLLNSRFDEQYPEISPDGRWIAYTSDESGRDEVYVQPFPGLGGKWQISDGGGSEPLWSRDGRELFYRLDWLHRQNQAFVVDVETGPVFSAGKPHLLFTAQGYSGMAPVSTWDVSPDGRRFLVVKMEERTSRPVTELVLVQNWIEELRRQGLAGDK